MKGPWVPLALVQRLPKHHLGHQLRSQRKLHQASTILMMKTSPLLSTWVISATSLKTKRKGSERNPKESKWANSSNNNNNSLKKKNSKNRVPLHILSRSRENIQVPLTRRHPRYKLQVLHRKQQTRRQVGSSKQPSLRRQHLKAKKEAELVEVKVQMHHKSLIQPTKWENNLIKHNQLIKAFSQPSTSQHLLHQGDSRTPRTTSVSIRPPRHSTEGWQAQLGLRQVSLPLHLAHLQLHSSHSNTLIQLVLLWISLMHDLSVQHQWGALHPLSLSLSTSNSISCSWQLSRNYRKLYQKTQESSWKML